MLSYMQAERIILRADRETSRDAVLVTVVEASINGLLYAADDFIEASLYSEKEESMESVLLTEIHTSVNALCYLSCLPSEFNFGTHRFSITVI
jgi:hypothetical protein